MRESCPRRWQTWRLKPAGTDLGAFARPRFDAPARPPASLSAGCAERPGPDGVRHDLVARVKAALAAGHYDRDDVWADAEAALIRRADAGT